MKIKFEQSDFDSLVGAFEVLWDQIAVLSAHLKESEDKRRKILSKCEAMVKILPPTVGVIQSEIHDIQCRISEIEGHLRDDVPWD